MAPIQILMLLFIVFFSIILHEVCHGYVAYLNGDDTAKMMGRLTFNPIPHIDPFGTILLPIMLLILSGGRFAIGMARPVPINPYNFRNFDKGLMAVGAAGPASNIVLGTLLALASRLTGSELLHSILILGAVINLILAFFNLVPIPPLDGSRILSVFLPSDLRARYESIERFGIMIVIAFFIFGGFTWLFPLVLRLVSFIAGYN